MRRGLDCPDAGRVCEPPRAPAPHLAPAVAATQASAERKTCPLGERDPDLLGRVEASPAPSPRPGRHRYDGHGGLSRREGAEHGLRCDIGQRQSACVLEPVDHTPCDAFERRSRDRQVHASGTGVDHRGRCRELLVAVLAEDRRRRASGAAGGTERRGNQRGDLLEGRGCDRAIVSRGG
jgi:hypothetical protein